MTTNVTVFAELPFHNGTPSETVNLTESFDVKTSQDGAKALIEQRGPSAGKVYEISAETQGIEGIEGYNRENEIDLETVSF